MPSSRHPSSYQPYSSTPSSMESTPLFATDKSLDLDDIVSPTSSDTPTATESNNWVLGCYLFCSVIVAVLNNITWKQTLDRFRAVDGSDVNFEFFVNQWTVFLYVLMAASILTYRLLVGGYITKEQRQFPTSKFALMGAFDSCAGLASAVGSAFTSGQVQTLCNQAAIPATMLMSVLFLRSRYSKIQYLGATLIVVGAAIAVIPSSGDASGRTTFLGLIILLVGLIPSSFSNVYKEGQFKIANMELWYMTTSVSIFQVAIGFLLFPILSLPGLGGLKLTDIPNNFSDGFRCFLGHKIHGFECHLDSPPYYILLAYVIVNFAYNTLLLLIVKHGSALLLVISSAISLPLTNLVFTQKIFMGKNAEASSIYNLLALVIVVVGFLTYSLAPDSDPSGDILLGQIAGGQAAYVTEERDHLAHLRRNRIKRLASFDAATSPAYRISKQQWNDAHLRPNNRHADTIHALNGTGGYQNASI